MNLMIRPINEGDPELISQSFQEQGWSKPAAQYEKYMEEHNLGLRYTFIAELDGMFAGYVNVIWDSLYPHFKEHHIPEISDFNVLMKHQRAGIGSRLMDHAEAAISERSSFAGIGVGLFSDYGKAQILYVKRGYIPDGKGIFDGERYLQYGDQMTVNHDLALYLTKRLGNERLR